MHSPGPWTIDEYGDHEISIFAANGEMVCDLIQWYCPKTGRGQNTAIDTDAQLIAAAPEMYKILTQLVEAFDSPDYGATDVLDLIGAKDSQVRAIVNKVKEKL